MKLKPINLQYNTIRNNMRNNSINDQLKPFKRRYKKEPTTPPSNWVEDGVDHINILEQSKTDLGRFLAHNSLYEFRHDKFGKFKTIEAFWYYIQSVERDDRIRVMHGRSLKSFISCLTMQHITNFRAIIMHTNFQKIKQYDFAVKLMKESTLPFDCYYINESGVLARPPYFKWLLRGFEELRKAIKEDAEPNLVFLLDSKKSGIYDYVLPSATLKDEDARLMQYLENN